MSEREKRLRQDYLLLEYFCPSSKSPRTNITKDKMSKDKYYKEQNIQKTNITKDKMSREQILQRTKCPENKLNKGQNG